MIFLLFELQLQEEVDTSRTTYEALNSQLLDELPTLIELATDIYTEAVKQFILARKLFVGRVTKELLQLMDVSSFYMKYYFQVILNFYVLLVGWVSAWEQD